MKRFRIAAMIFVATGVISLGAGSVRCQTASSSATAERGSEPLGTLLKGKGVVGKLTKAIDTKHAKAGDPVTVEVTSDVKSDGQVVLAKGSLIKGTIAQAQAFSKGKADAELNIVFDTVVPKGGQESSTHLLIYALAAKMDHAPTPEDIYATQGYKGAANSASVSGHNGGVAGGNDLTPESQGIFGFDDLELHPAASTNPPTSSVTCAKKNISFENGTHIVLVFAGV
jgi:hypothetical protein